MKHNSVSRMVLAAVLVAASHVFGATKTVTWTLPADWEGTVELDQICEPVGAPSVPYYNALIEVPSTATNFAITASGVTYRASDKARPTPVLEPSVVGEPANAPVEDAALYAGIYPSDVFEQGEPWEMNGKTYLPVRVKVYRWNGPAAKVEALESLTLSIACAMKVEGRKLKVASLSTFNSQLSSLPSTGVDYIVISPHNFVSYWQKFIDYRKTTHTNMTFQIVDANDIYNTYSGHDDALKIHHFIEAMYALGTRYILLGAGAQHTGYDRNSMIMTRICVTKDSRTQSCDYYYCVTDYKGGKEVWDYNGDQIYLASKNSSGGYAADAAANISWEGTIKVHRFPARTSITMGGKTRSAQEQIEGYVEKLKRYEQGLFVGRFSQAVIANTLSESYNRYHGNTSAECTQERQFYDLGANIFSEEHGATTALNEYETRERAPSYYTLRRPVGYNRSVLQLYYSNGENANTFYGRDFDSMIINSHGSPETVEPLTREGVFNSTGLSGFHFLIVPCHAGNPCSGNNNVVSISEAGVVNPEGGSLVSYGNSNTGLWGGKDTLSEKIERDVVKMLYACQDGNYYNAGEARLWAMNCFKWNGLSPNSAGGLLMCDSMAYGDPLVKLSPIWARTVDANGVWRRDDGGENGESGEKGEMEYASTLTVNAGTDDMTLNITNEIGAAWLNVNGAAGKTLTLKGSGKGRFKVTNKVTVNDGMTLNWEVPGGFGRNGVNMANGGNLRLRAAGYYGIDFRNIGDLTVAPTSGTAILDFDSKNYFRNGDGYFKTLTVKGPGETIFRSRQAGIFSTDFTIPVTGGTLTLETPCVGGSGQQTSTVPLFAVTNAVLAVRPNPNWSAECFSRRVTFENATLTNAYDKFYLGANVSGYPGLDISVGGANNVFTGTSPIRLNGQLRIHTATGGVLNVAAELVNGNGAGAVAIDTGITLRLAAVNTFSGGVTVPNGARLVVDNVRGLGTGGIVVQSGGVLQLNAMPMAGVSSVTLQSGAKLVLKSSGSGGSYQMYSPATTSFTMADGVSVYDAANENTPLEGIVTPEGAYFISDAAKAWRGVPMTWSSTSTAQAWMRQGVPTTYADGDTVLFKDVANVPQTTVYVSGEVKPGMVAFQNSATDYVFDGADASITVGSMATTGKTTFEPSIKATSQVSVGGHTKVTDITTPVLNVAGGGALNVSGTVSGIDTIRVIQFKITDTMGPHNSTPRTNAPELSELQFFDGNGTYLFFPTGTVIKDSEDNVTTVSGRNGNAYEFDNDNSLKNLFDGSISTYHMIGSSITGPWTITLTFPESTPMEMFGKFKYGRAKARTPSYWLYALDGDYPDANPRTWYMYAGDSESALKQVCSNSAIDGTASQLTGFFTVNWTSSSKAVVQNGGTLYLNGTYNLPVEIKSGATLAVTNDSVLTFGGSKSFPSGTYSMTVDATEAKKTNGWFQVTQKAALSSAWLFQTDDETAVDVRSGELWVATAGVMAPPYSRTLCESGNWNTTDWMNGKNAQFEKTWGDSITKSTGSAILNVTGTNLTMSADCSVALDTLTITTPTNCRPETLTVTTTNGGAANISAIDLRTFNGFVDWQPTLASWGCNVYVGTNSVKITDMTSGKGALQVSAGGRATVPQKFASYDVDMSSYLRFTGTHSFSVDNDLPAKGIQSFDDTTFVGGFQKSAVTYLVEDGDTLVFTGDGNNYNGRMSSSFDIRGGSVTIDSNGVSTWFGINGDTSYTQTGGVFKCTANGTGTSGTGNGLLLGYSETKTEDFEFDISGGRFEVPYSSINFFGRARFSLVSNGVVQAKGVMKSGGNKGTITVNHGTTFEIGSIGLCADSCDFNLFGGTLAGFEDGAKTVGDINLVGYGTLAAADGTTLTVKGGIVADGATLNVGVKGRYEGTVKMTAIPSGITNVVISAGTLNLGTYRPVTKTLAVSGGAIAITLSNAQIMDAQTNAVRIIKAAAIPQGGVLVYNKKGHLQDGTVVEIVDGYLTVRTATTVQRVANAVWSNFGNATVGGIGTAMGNGNYNNFTANFGVADNIAIKEIDGEGMLKLRKIRFGQRDTKSNVPSGLKITQGAKVITSTGVSVSASNVDIVLYLKDYLSNSKQKYSFYSYTFTFADDASALDCSKDFTFTFTDGNGSAMNAGIRAMQPANSSLAISGYAPCVEITGDYSYDPVTLEDDVGGDSVSINVIGGNNGLSGKSIASDNYAGVIPVKGANWNQTVTKTDKSAVSESKSNLLEILADGSAINGPMTATFTAACAYVANNSTPSGGDAEMMYGYLDDGQTSGDYGATIKVENIPYTTYDVYVYMGTDQKDSGKKFAPVTIVGGNKTEQYPTTTTGWGDALSARGTVTLCETNNYLKFTGISGGTLTVKGAKNGSVSDARCGIAGIQIVNTGVRQEIYTWEGGDEGAWSENTASWQSPEGASVAWPCAGENLVAQFTNDASVRIEGEVVAPTVKFEKANEVRTFDGYVPTASTKLFEGVKLSDIVSFAGQLAGGWVANGAASVYHISRTGSLATMQFQKVDDGYVKCAKLELTQAGTDIFGRVLYSRNMQNGSIGLDFDTASGYGTADTSTTDGDKGYGIKDLTISVKQKGMLTIANAGGLVGELALADGELSIAAGEMKADLTLGDGASLNVSRLFVGNVVVTSGALNGVAADFSNVTINGAAISTGDYELVGGTFMLKRPMLSDEDGTISVNPTNAAEYVVSAENVKPQITIEGAGDHTIVVPPAVTNVVGVAPEKIKVRHGGHDITSAFTKSGNAAGVVLALNPDGKVVINGEEIAVTPEFSTMDGDEHVADAPFVVGDENAAVGVKSIPGLTYRLMRGAEIGAYGHEAAAETATGPRVKLQDAHKPEDKAFYVIQVEAGSN